MTPEEFHKRGVSYIKNADDPETTKKLEEFKSIMSYVSGAYDGDEGYGALLKALEEIESKYQTKEINRLFYMALPPSVFIPVAQGLRRNCYTPNGTNRIIVEKPFGKDLESCRHMMTALKKEWSEDETFRIDHYLGKEMVKNILVLRFANIVFSSGWSNQAIKSVQITFKEPFGTEGRGGYFDEFGIIRDIQQNHLLQVLSILTMERPVSFSSEDIRDEKVKVLRAIPPIAKEDVLLGQYVAADGKPGYLDDDTVPKNSVCPTFAALTLWIHNPRWEGVPFILKAGKALNEAKVEIRIQYRDVTQGIFKDISRNELVLRIQPSEAVYVKINAKTPGLYTRAIPTEMDLTYKRRFTETKIPEAYEALILDALKGDHSNFVRDDELDVAWKIFTPILHWIEGRDGPAPRPQPYPYGSRGPKELNDFITKYGYKRADTGYLYRTTKLEYPVLGIMTRNSDDEHKEGEGVEEAPPPRRSPPGNGSIGSQTATSCSQAECNRESTGAPKPNNEPKSTRSMAAVPPKTVQNCPSAPTSQAHMGPTSPPAPPPSPRPPPATMPPTEAEKEALPTPPRPSVLLPLLRCALCRLLLTAPTTLNCGHTVCSKHMSTREEPESPVGSCPVEGCRPRQPARVCMMGHPNELEAGVTFTPAPSSAPSESSISTTPLARVVKLDVTASKLLELITTAVRRNTPPESTHREDSPATDEEDPIGIRTCPRSASPDRTPSGSYRAASQSPPRPRKRLRTRSPLHTPTGLPDPPPSSSFEKDLLSELTCEICFLLLCNPITTPCQHTFCSTCLERSLDHSTKCPLCRLDLPPNSYFYQHAHNEVIVQIIAKSFPHLLEERVTIADTDGRDSRLDTPIFVCQLSYPGMPTLLHFFEPRIDDYPPEVEAEIERIAMMNPTEGDLTMRGIERSNQELVDVCRRFLDQLRNGTAPWVVQRLNNTYGPMPNDVASFSFWVALVLPIDEQEKAKLLPIRSPRMRLRLVVHWIEQLNNNWWFSSGTWIILQLFRR
ncbi:unnamed protein product [Rhizoctonia solani]|uniref:Glucose-6-phosphate 1-dehydrogenase n=1 Tax=Rhizoctonia solani TaxID=456999 RepID=A0A8H3HEY8_9AGAM|nr:unnamed protein product [Rhizoctonia solani]